MYYAKFYVGGKPRRVSLHTDSFQIAKAKLCTIEANLSKGDESPLPTRTPIADILTRYVQHIRTIKTAKSAQTDVYYLRQIFGPICPVVQINSRRPSPKARKRPPLPGQDRRFKTQTIDVTCIEQITTQDIASFIGSQVRSRGLAPKTANRFREILHRFFSWSMEQGGIKMPLDKNPAAKVERYKEQAPKISFLTLSQIDEQLVALKDFPQLQTMVAVYIYAGLRREEALWLTVDDVYLPAGQNGIIRIQAKTVNEEFWQAKTKINRSIPVSSTLRFYLDRYKPRPSEGNWFFPSPQGKRWNPDNFSQDLREANEAVNLTWGCLDFRHTFGSQLAMKGESLYKISTLMGNSPEICRRHYAALIPEALIDTVEFPKATPKLRLVGT